MDILPTLPSTKGPAQIFTGDVWFDQIVPMDGPQQGRCNAVHFGPGARTAWHSHANGQLLHVTEGVGLTGTRNGEVVVIRPGDTVWCPPGEEHWHGAAPDSFMTHLAIWDGLSEGQDGPETVWGEHVSDAEYGYPDGQQLA
jgi:quercetin dioxygenase-like cupin family protein